MLSRSENVTCRSFSVRNDTLGVGGEARNGKTCSGSGFTGSCFGAGSFCFLSWDFLLCRRCFALRLVLDEAALGAGEAADPVLLVLLARPRDTGRKTESGVSAARMAGSDDGAGI